MGIKMSNLCSRKKNNAAHAIARAILLARSDVYKQKYNMVALIVNSIITIQKIACGATNRQYQQATSNKTQQ